MLISLNGYSVSKQLIDDCVTPRRTTAVDQRRDTACEFHSFPDGLSHDVDFTLFDRLSGNVGSTLS